MLIVKCDGNKEDNKNYFFCFFEIWTFYFFSVHDIAYNPPDLFVALFIIWLGRESAFYHPWTERGWRVEEIIHLLMTTMNSILR